MLLCRGLTSMKRSGKYDEISAAYMASRIMQAANDTFNTIFGFEVGSIIVDVFLSFHNYQSVQNDLRRQEDKIHHNQAQLASGKKLQSPSDDPLAAFTIYKILVSNQSSLSNIVTQSSWFVIDWSITRYWSPIPRALLMKQNEL